MGLAVSMKTYGFLIFVFIQSVSLRADTSPPPRIFVTEGVTEESCLVSVNAAKEEKILPQHCAKMFIISFLS